jgi:hypothetical protein
MNIKMMEEMAKATYIAHLEQQVEKLSLALEWYQEHAQAVQRNQNNPQALLAIITTLKLDNGSRAAQVLLSNQALNLTPKPQKTEPPTQVETNENRQKD